MWRKLLKRWWTRGDSNPRPPRCERGALPAELLAHEQQRNFSKRWVGKPPAVDGVEIVVIRPTMGGLCESGSPSKTHGKTRPPYSKEKRARIAPSWLTNLYD